MSNALAIAAVTAVLRDLLTNALIDHDLDLTGGAVTVSTWPPDRVATLQGSTPSTQLNLFLYQVLNNAGRSNVSLPSRDSRGQRLTNPPLALDLRYLLTAYGAQEFDAEKLLGFGMQVLHETPVLSRDAIRRALAPASPVTGGGLPPEFQTLSSADLADQVEQVTISPIYLNPEEMSHIWSPLQSSYRPSTAYHVSTVLIESQRSTRVSLPVRQYNLYGIPVKRPVIERLASRPAAPPEAPVELNQPIVADRRLVIIGHRLASESVLVRIGGIDATPAADDVSDTQITVPIPEGVQAGVQGAQVVHQLDIGTPPQPHRYLESNVVAFVYTPAVVQLADDSYDIAVTDIADVDGLRNATLTVGLTPAVGRDQRVTVLLNELGAPTDQPPRAYSFPANAWPSDTDDTLEQIAFGVSAVEPGNYLLRVQVDGAVSLLETGTAGTFESPSVTI